MAVSVYDTGELFPGGPYDFTAGGELGYLIVDSAQLVSGPDFFDAATPRPGPTFIKIEVWISGLDLLTVTTVTGYDFDPGPATSTPHSAFALGADPHVTLSYSTHIGWGGGLETAADFWHAGAIGPGPELTFGALSTVRSLSGHARVTLDSSPLPAWIVGAVGAAAAAI